MNTRRQLTTGLIAAFVLSLAACSPAAGADPFPGTQWVLESLDGSQDVGAAIGGKDITLNFDQEQRVAGSAGCNSYGGGYEMGDGPDTLLFSQMVSTRMACVDGNVMEVEQHYLQAMELVGAYALAGGTLTISGGGHTLVFVRH